MRRWFHRPEACSPSCLALPPRAAAACLTTAVPVISLPAAAVSGCLAAAHKPVRQLGVPLCHMAGTFAAKAWRSKSPWFGAIGRVDGQMSLGRAAHEAAAESPPSTMREARPLPHGSSTEREVESRPAGCLPGQLDPDSGVPPRSLLGTARKRGMRQAPFLRLIRTCHPAHPFPFIPVLIHGWRHVSWQYKNATHPADPVSPRCS